MTQIAKYKGPLAGLNVIDFGHYYAGPLVGMLLADQGANVIRVVRPGEPELREQQYRLLNRNKKLLTLDLKTEAGKGQALSLIERADVMIENFRPGVMCRLGLDYANVKASNPRLVYLSLPGFASTDKARAHIQAWEGILAAAAGMHTMGFNQVLDFPPVYTPIPQCSTNGGITGAIAVMAALVAREKYGVGTVLEVPLVDAGLQGRNDAIIGSGFAGVEGAHPFNQPMAESPNFSEFQYSSEDSPTDQLEKLYEAFWSGVMVPGYAPMTCADGRQVFTWAQDMQSTCRAYYQALGIEKQLLSKGFVYAGTWEMDLDNNLNYPYGLSAERKQRLLTLIAEVMLSKSAEDWERILRQAGQCCGVVRTRNEFLALEPMLKAEVIIRMDNGTSELTVPGRLADISVPGEDLFDGDFREAEFITYAQAKDLFQTQPLKPSDINTIQRPLKKGDLLSGLNVLELGSFISAPYAGYILAQFGAEVIKSDTSLVVPHFLWHPLEQNQGKRSLLANLNTAPGQDILGKLVEQADLVLHNVRPGTDRRLGVDRDRLKQLNPNVISAQVCALGGTRHGPWEEFRGIEPVGPCITGLWAHYGTLDKPLLHGGTDSSDIPGGLSLAFASLVAVYQQRKTGYAGEARTSLVRGTCYYQLPWMIAENGSSDWGEVRGQFALGEHRWQRLYACRDRWLYIGTTEARAPELARVVTDDENTDVSALEAAFANQHCQHWITVLDNAGIACHKVMKLSDICAQNTRDVSNPAADETITSTTEILRYTDHPSGISIIVKAPSAIRVGEAHTYKKLALAPSFGENSKAILAELGYSRDETAELIRLKVVHEHLPALKHKGEYFLDHQSDVNFIDRD